MLPHTVPDAAVMAVCMVADDDARVAVPAEVATVIVPGTLPEADQYARFACMADARLDASMDARAREREALVLDSAKPCILAIPSMPTAMMMRATMTSTKVKPRVAEGVSLLKFFMYMSAPIP